MTEIEEFEAYRPGEVPTQAIKMLTTWRDRPGRKATVGKLIKAMQRAKIQEHCYKEAVVDFFSDFDSDDS